MDEPFQESRGVSPWRRLREGIRILMRHPLLRGGVGCASTVNFFTFMIAAVYVLYASRTLGLSAGLIGITLGVGALGALLGAVVAPRIGRRLGLGPTTVIGCVLFTAPLALIPFAFGPTLVKAAILGFAEFVSGIGVMLFDVSLNSLNTLATPHRLRARLAGASRFFNYGTRPFGALLGGRARRRDRPAADAAGRVDRRRAVGRVAARVADRGHAPPRAGAGPVSRAEILRNGPLRALLAAEVISTTGAQMTWLALPWFVLVTTDSPAQMTLVMIAELVGLTVAGLPSGAVLQRLGARRTMLASRRDPRAADAPRARCSTGTGTSRSACCSRWRSHSALSVRRTSPPSD